MESTLVTYQLFFQTNFTVYLITKNYIILCFSSTYTKSYSVIPHNSFFLFVLMDFSDNFMGKEKIVV